jgi:hypothetical protein
MKLNSTALLTVSAVCPAPPLVVMRRLQGAPKIDLSIGFSRGNTEKRGLP